MPIATSRLTWVLAVLIGALLAFAVLAAGPASSPVPAVPSAAAADKDCKDFDSRRQAQRFFERHNPKKDPHNLDADDDGKACEDYDY
jgi:hypothetical protein